MSSLRLIPARTLPLFRTGRFSFSTSLTYRKSTVESATETIKNADRKVADKLGEGIEKGGAAAAKVKDAMGLGAKKAEGSASEMAGETKGKTSEMAGKASGKASEMTGQAKGKASEVAGEVKGKM
ncbi:MAG: hypothetical protein Q9190_000624 [Brigantiaea leucoxantha]